MDGLSTRPFQSSITGKTSYDYGTETCPLLALLDTLRLLENDFAEQPYQSANRRAHRKDFLQRMQLQNSNACSAS